MKECNKGFFVILIRRSRRRIPFMPNKTLMEILRPDKVLGLRMTAEVKNEV